MISAQQWWKVAILGFVFSFVLIATTSQVFAQVQAEAPETEVDTVCINPAIPLGGITLEIPLGVTNGNIALDLPDYLSKFYQFVVASIAILAAAKIIIAGFNWVFAAGSQEKIGKAKEDLSGAIWGLMIALLSYTILNIVNPKLVEIPPICPPVPDFGVPDSAVNQGQACKEQKDCGSSGKYHCVIKNVIKNSLNTFANLSEEKICSDGRNGTSCMVSTGDFTGDDSWCQSGDCNNLTGYCQEPNYGAYCDFNKPCASGYICVGDFSCSDGREGSFCSDLAGKTADQYCKKPLTCQSKKCAPPATP